MPSAGIGNGRSRSTDTTVITATGAKAARRLTPQALALREAVRENAVDAFIDVDHLDVAQRWDDDDYPDAQDGADLGDPDDDEPRAEDDDEGAPHRPRRPEIFLWLSADGERILADVRPSAAALLDERAMARGVLDREERLATYAAGLIDHFRGMPELLAKPLLRIWEEGLKDDEEQKKAARRWGFAPSDTELSRDAAVLVALPNDRIVPLQFFSWKSSSDHWVKRIAEADIVRDLDVPRLAAVASIFGAGAALRPDRNIAQHFFPWVRAAATNRSVVARYRSLLGSHPAEFKAIRTQFGEALIAKSPEPEELLKRMNRRNAVLNRALIGGIR